MLGAAGATEFIVSLLSIQDQCVPPTINLHEIDPECGDLNFTPNEAQQRVVRAALSNSAGFGGHNVTLAVKRYDK
jgi:3-oxoacyl-[acyl-carrier-protein] synthase II